MSVAYSQHTILKATIRADTSAHFRADIDALVLGVGWNTIRSVSNGKVYEMTAPVSGIAARLLVQDQGTGSGAGSWIIFQMLNHAETVAGIAHTIVVGGAVTAYQAIAGICQLFLSVPHQVSAIFLGDQSSSFACGVPSLPPNTPGSVCETGIGDPPAVTEVWWSCGPGNAAFFYAPDFRLGPTCFEQFCYDLNGALTTAPITEDPSSGPLGLGYLTPTFNVDGNNAPNQPVKTYAIGSPLRLDAFLLFAWQIRGQLWDAFQLSAPAGLDAQLSFFDENADGTQFQINVQAWNSAYYSSLMLLTENPFSTGSFAYVY